jgi:hypothetical protein
MPAVLELLASAPSELSWAGTRGTCVIDLSEPSLGVAATGRPASGLQPALRLVRRTMSQTAARASAPRPR